MEFSAPQLTIMGEAATPARQEDVVQVAGHAYHTWAEEAMDSMMGLLAARFVGLQLSYAFF